MLGGSRGASSDQVKVSSESEEPDRSSVELTCAISSGTAFHGVCCHRAVVGGVVGKGSGLACVSVA